MFVHSNSGLQQPNHQLTTISVYPFFFNYLLQTSVCRAVLICIFMQICRPITDDRQYREETIAFTSHPGIHQLSIQINKWQMSIPSQCLDRSKTTRNTKYIRCDSNNNMSSHLILFECNLHFVLYFKSNIYKRHNSLLQFVFQSNTFFFVSFFFFFVRIVIVSSIFLLSTRY